MSAEAQADMHAWMKLAQPGEHHGHLKKFIGKWNATVEMWMEPGSEPMVSSAETEVSFLMGERFIQWQHSGNFGGMPFEGLSIEGYDNGSQQYQGMWIDNFGTLMLHFTGQCSYDVMKRGASASFHNPMDDGTIDMRFEIEWQDDDHFTYTSFMIKGGESDEYKNMTIAYERAAM